MTKIGQHIQYLRVRTRREAWSLVVALGVSSVVYFVRAFYTGATDFSVSLLFTLIAAYVLSSALLEHGLLASFSAVWPLSQVGHPLEVGLGNQPAPEEAATTYLMAEIDPRALISVEEVSGEVEAMLKLGKEGEVAAVLGASVLASFGGPTHAALALAVAHRLARTYGPALHIGVHSSSSVRDRALATLTVAKIADASPSGGIYCSSDTIDFVLVSENVSASEFVQVKLSPEPAPTVRNLPRNIRIFSLRV